MATANHQPPATPRPAMRPAPNQTVHFATPRPAMQSAAKQLATPANRLGSIARVPGMVSASQQLRVANRLDACARCNEAGPLCLCRRCGFRVHPGCAFPELPAKVTRFLCDTCAQEEPVQPHHAFCAVCGDAHADVRCNTCRSAWHPACASSCPSCEARKTAASRDADIVLRSWDVQLTPARARNVVCVTGQRIDNAEHFKTPEVSCSVPKTGLRTTAIVSFNNFS